MGGGAGFDLTSKAERERKLIIELGKCLRGRTSILESWLVLYSMTSFLYVCIILMMDGVMTDECGWLYLFSFYKRLFYRDEITT